jgi:hypothetical protein
VANSVAKGKTKGATRRPPHRADANPLRRQSADEQRACNSFSVISRSGVAMMTNPGVRTFSIPGHSWFGQ